MPNVKILNIKISEFEGPLDVLSTLIQEKKMNIMDVDLIEIIDQYLAYIDVNYDDIEINNAIEYMTMATYLIEVKSKRMLVVENPLTDPTSFEYERDRLLRRIVEHNKYKMICGYLRRRMEHRGKMFAKSNDDSEEQIIESIAYVDKLPEKIEAERILKALSDAIEKYRFLMLSRKGLKLKEVSVEFVKNQLINFLKNNDKNVTLSKYIEHLIVSDKINLGYFVVLFCAILEMGRHGLANIEQNNSELVVSLI
ncbi:MAG: segregation/condensation protein A [Mycoplasmataceae bacterium]|jgi:segregation and condensation protein A|nr:segregation/condensation protein A [Mycoplasmataceae bacterium]